VRHVRGGAGVHERRLQLRGYHLRGVLLERPVRGLDRRHVRRRRRRVYPVPARPGLQCAGEVRVHGRVLPERLLRCEPALQHLRQRHLRRGRRSVPDLRGGARLQRRAMRLQRDLVPQRLLQRQYLRDDAEHVGVRQRAPVHDV
jgi:hypothetical protein